MKKRMLLLIGGVAMMTLSFTYANVKYTSRQVKKETVVEERTEPVGGFASNEIVK
jgi:hypothetical protein